MEPGDAPNALKSQQYLFLLGKCACLKQNIQEILSEMREEVRNRLIPAVHVTVVVFVASVICWLPYDSVWCEYKSETGSLLIMGTFGCSTVEATSDWLTPTF